MKETRITSTELARSVGDILNRVHYRGESFVVERNGKPVAVVSPPSARATTSLRSVLLPWLEVGGSDPEFADVLEEIGREDRPATDPWE